MDFRLEGPRASELSAFCREILALEADLLSVVLLYMYCYFVCMVFFFGCTVLACGKFSSPTRD